MFVAVATPPHLTPEAYEKGKEIVTPSEMPDNSVLFHSGTSIKDGKLVSSVEGC